MQNKNEILNSQFENNQSLNIREEIEKYVFYWKWFLLGVIIAIISAFLYLRYTASIYNATATILIKDNKKAGISKELAAFEDLGIIGGGSSNNTDNEIEIVGSNMKMKRLDNGTPGKLQGAWLMSGRVRNGETQARDTSRPRKTMKILSGTRFQWIAYNTETKQFSGTGGGTYTTIDGKYTENIEFFSKDEAKVGLSLDFNFELVDGDWTHTGFSSKGAPIHEIWSVRNK